MGEKTFGIRLENEKYKDRIGVYAIILNNSGKVATVKIEKGYFLIGSGIKKEETYRECLMRECLEETGYDIEIKEFICKSDNYHFSDSLNYYFHPIGYLRSKVQEPIETDHKLEWISIKELEEKMYLEHQIWAIEEAINL